MSSSFDTRRNLLIALCSSPLAALAPVARAAEGSFVPRQGIEYQVLQAPQPTESGDRIEVLEFFQYTCPHCYHFTPNLEAWRKHLPADVAYRRVALSFDPAGQNLVRLYYTLEALNKTDELHDKVFDAIHKLHRQLTEANDIADFMASNGIDRAQWMATFNSFSVVTRSQQSGKLVAAYQIEGTPTIAIDGKYLTAPSMIKVDSSDRANAAEMARVGALSVMDYLIDRTRHDRHPAPAAAPKKK